jgi:DNA-binding NtrC family response regulator
LKLVLAPSRAQPDGLELLLPKAAWQQLQTHPWPGNTRELAMVLHNIVVFTLVAALDAVRAGVALSSPRLQVDPGLVGELLAASSLGVASAATPGATATNAVSVVLARGSTLNAVAVDVERQYFLALFLQHRGDFAAMAEALLGDRNKARAVRLRFNQLGLSVRQLREQTQLHDEAVEADA